MARAEYLTLLFGDARQVFGPGSLPRYENITTVPSYAGEHVIFSQRATNFRQCGPGLLLRLIQSAPRSDNLWSRGYKLQRRAMSWSQDARGDGPCGLKLLFGRFVLPKRGVSRSQRSANLRFHARLIAQGRAQFCGSLVQDIHKANIPAVPSRTAEVIMCSRKRHRSVLTVPGGPHRGRGRVTHERRTPARVAAIRMTAVTNPVTYSDEVFSQRIPPYVSPGWVRRPDSGGYHRPARPAFDTAVGLCQTFHDDGIDLVIQVAGDGARANRLYPAYVVEQFADATGHVVRESTGQDLIEDNTQRIHIGAYIDAWRRLQLLGAGPRQRAHELAGHAHGAHRRIIRINNGFCQAEIADMRPAGGVDQDIAGLQVTMDYASLVGVIHGVADFGEESQRVRFEF